MIEAFIISLPIWALVGCVYRVARELSIQTTIIQLSSAGYGKQQGSNQ